RSSSERTFGAQLFADPSAPRRWLRRFSLTGDGTLISCTLADGLTTLSVRGRTARRTAPSPRPGRLSAGSRRLRNGRSSPGRCTCSCRRGAGQELFPADRPPLPLAGRNKIGETL